MNNIKEKIKNTMRQAFDITEIPDNISQDNCSKWDSLHHLNLVVELESAFEVSIEPDEIAVMKSMDDIIRIIKSKLNQT